MKTSKTYAYWFLGIATLLITISINQVVALPDLVTNTGQRIQEIPSMILAAFHPISESANQQPQTTSPSSETQQVAVVEHTNEVGPNAEVSFSSNIAKTESDLSNKKISFSTIFLSLRKSCVDREIDLMRFTHWMTEQYLRVYGYEIGKTGMQCIFLNDFINGNYDQYLTEGKHFLLFATNALQAIQFVEHEYYKMPVNEPRYYGGLAKINVVLVQAYKTEGKFGTAWILSHELAHWVLMERGNPLHREGVHQYEELWRSCANPDLCPDIWFKIEYPYEPYMGQYYMMDVQPLLSQ